MIPPVKAIRRVLYENVYYKGSLVPVIKRSYPEDETPCITVDDSGGSASIERFITNVDYPLSSDHPQFDPDNPFRKQSQQVFREVFETTVNVHVWCDTERMREDINNQVDLLFHQAQADYYKFCSNYMGGNCKDSTTPCMVDLSPTDKRGVKKQCPNPELYGYENIFTKYNLIRSSFIVEQPFTLDDLSKKEPVLHSVFRVRTGYYVDHIIGGHISQGLVHDSSVIPENINDY